MRKKKAVKKKKSLKRLERVEELLSKLIDKFSADVSGVRELLNSGRAFVVRATAQVKAPKKGSSRSAVKSSAKKTSIHPAKKPVESAKKAPRLTKRRRSPARSLKPRSAPARGAVDTEALASAG